MSELFKLLADVKDATGKTCTLEIKANGFIYVRAGKIPIANAVNEENLIFILKNRVFALQNFVKKV